MARKANDGHGSTSGFAEADAIRPPNVPIVPDPGPRSLTDSDWVKRDREFKEALPQQKFY